MRRAWVVAGFAFALPIPGSAQTEAGARDGWWASKRYYTGLAQQCPQKHLDLMAYGELPDLIDAFGKRLSKAEWAAIRRAEADRCGADAIGASCGNEGFLRVMVERKRLGEFVQFVCALPEHCTERAECERD